MNTAKWIDRKFNFEESSLERQLLVNRLQATGNRIRKILAAVPEVKMELRNDGKWSIKENVGHLIDLEDLHLNRLRELKDGKTTLTPADLKNADTESAAHDSVKIRILISSLESRRSDFVEFLSGLSEPELAHEALHERLGIMMKPMELAYFVAEHDDHHINIIKGIIDLMDFDD